MQVDAPYLRSVAQKFAINGRVIDVIPYGTGHINDTYLSAWSVDSNIVRYIQQRINHKVFPFPAQVMHNIVRVTEHLQNKFIAINKRKAVREVLTVIPTKNGTPFYHDKEGNFWRTYVFITNAKTYDVCNSVSHAYEAAKAFARFQADLSDLAANSLCETIPCFHHAPKRFQALEQAIVSDKCNRCSSVREEIQFCMDRKVLITRITSLLENGQIPERITHNDTKINNVMVDNDTGAGICVIDLDTVMPGSILYDFGDMVRTITCTAEEDEQDLLKVSMDIKLFEALLKGYLETAGSFLVPAEIENLIVAGKLMTFTIGIRFLADYLMGNVYFKIKRPAHNLERARVQFKMIKSMEQQEDKMQTILRQYI